MENILTQRFSFARITPHKNYCKISRKSLYTPREIYNSQGENHFLSNDMGGPIFFSEKVVSSSVETVFIGPKRKNRRTKYFHQDKEEKIYFELASDKFTSLDPFVTTKDRHIKNHFGDPFSDIELHTYERSVKIRNNKLVIKLYHGQKYRRCNWLYFRKTYYVTTISIDLSKGNITTTRITKGANGSSSRKFTTNSFYELREIIMNTGLIDVKSEYLNKENSKHLIEEFKNEFCNLKLSNAINSVLGFDYFLYSNDKFMLYKLLTNLFVQLKKIKVPNSFDNLLLHYYPTEKYLKKNDRKLIASILDFFNIKSKITIKILHENPNINLYFLHTICKLFGHNYHKYIGNINTTIFFETGISNTKQSNLYQDNSRISKYQISENKINFFLTEVEKDNLLKLLNSLPNDQYHISSSLIGLLMDHFRMIEMIREYIPDCYMKSKNYSELHEEHTELATIQRTIKKGWVNEYKFNEEMVNSVETPIEVEIEISDEEVAKETFFPYILKREEEYVEEGEFMHHCVASYSDKDKSIIVSIRNEDKSDRITCEFDCQTGGLLQAKHFCNRQPPGDMELALAKLLNKIKYYSRLGMLHAVEKKRVPLIINGVEIKPPLVQPELREGLFLF